MHLTHERVLTLKWLFIYEFTNVPGHKAKTFENEQYSLQRWCLAIVNGLLTGFKNSKVRTTLKIIVWWTIIGKTFTVKFIVFMVNFIFNENESSIMRAPAKRMLVLFEQADSRSRSFNSFLLKQICNFSNLYSCRRRKWNYSFPRVSR